MSDSKEQKSILQHTQDTGRDSSDFSAFEKIANEGLYSRRSQIQAIERENKREELAENFEAAEKLKSVSDRDNLNDLVTNKSSAMDPDDFEGMTISKEIEEAKKRADMLSEADDLELYDNDEETDIGKFKPQNLSEKRLLEWRKYWGYKKKILSQKPRKMNLKER